MAFTIPNERVGFEELSQLDAVDFTVIQQGVGGIGVESATSLVCSPSGHQVAVSAGAVVVPDGWSAIEAATVDIPTIAGGSDRRIDLIVARANLGAPGTFDLTRLGGTAAANPIAPTTTVLDIVLAAVLVRPGDTSLAADSIVDKRMIVAAPGGRASITSPATGVVGDGVADDGPALAAALAAGGSWWIDGNFRVAATMDIAVAGDLDVECSAGTRIWADNAPGGFGTAPNTGDLFDWTTASGADDIDFSWQGGLLDGHDLPPSSVAWPFPAAAWTEFMAPQQKGTVHTTAGVFEFRNSEFRRISVENVRFFMSDPDDANPHWMGAGGDSAFFTNCGDEVVVRACTFVGSSDSAIYLSAAASNRPLSSARITGNRFVNTNGVAIKRKTTDGVVNDNVFQNCPRAFGVTVGSSNEGDSRAIVFSSNVVDGYWQAVQIHSSSEVNVTGNMFTNAGIRLKDGSRPAYDAGAATAGQPGFFSKHTIVDVKGSERVTVTGNSMFGIDQSDPFPVEYDVNDNYKPRVSTVDDDNGRGTIGALFAGNRMDGMFALGDERGTLSTGNIWRIDEGEWTGDRAPQVFNINPGSRVVVPDVHEVTFLDQPARGSSFLGPELLDATGTPVPGAARIFSQALSKGAVYAVDLLLLVSGSTGGDLKLAWSGGLLSDPGFWGAFGADDTSATTTDTVQHLGSDWSATRTVAVHGASPGSPTVVRVQGRIVPDSGGTLSFKYASTSNSNPVTLHAGSSMTVRRIAG